MNPSFRSSSTPLVGFRPVFKVYTNKQQWGVIPEIRAARLYAKYLSTWVDGHIYVEFYGIIRGKRVDG